MATTKRRVTMRGAFPLPDGRGVASTEAVDYVPEEILDAYLARARARWQTVEVSAEFDAGPGGLTGLTWVPVDLDHPLAGTFI
jgi:hypothetical protein